MVRGGRRATPSWSTKSSTKLLVAAPQLATGSTVPGRCDQRRRSPEGGTCCPPWLRKTHLRRLPAHGLIDRIPGTHRYHVTDPGLRHALLLTRAHTRLLRTGLAEINGPPGPSKLRAAARTYEHAIKDLTRAAGLAA